jgi:hypothetical protein
MPSIVSRIDYKNVRGIPQVGLIICIQKGTMCYIVNLQWVSGDEIPKELIKVLKSLVFYVFPKE